MRNEKEYNDSRREQGYKRINIWFKPQIIRMIKQMRILEPMTITGLVERAVECYAKAKLPVTTKGENE